MKIKINLTVEVDPAAWSFIYGTSDADVREDVKRYIRTGIEDQPDGLIKIVETKKALK